ncbi:DUF1934 domain-containing protein [Clostridium folliculivorans]|uniref:DUF1934 domain-containing protein n=1 Tax=Clostridium folliculivorans TaxID=2886038 RepID=A0A9W5XYI4_9CLOT|nr:DUF1934 domain-containing protein [Clostridium folliculivorans]GKU23292.1 hypothetical protein CFOLD11_01180 [Clostridium folliculivorans]GKU29409.1 hypothetical protein CFB3_15150 [Clostridium folliculivorans]
MKKKAIISIASNQVPADQEDLIEVVTPGEFLIKEDGYEAIYDETEISGMEGTKTKISITSNELILEREGTTATKMNFQKDNTSISLYNTPYGMLELKIDTKELKIDIDEYGGDIFIDYDLSVSGQESNNTQLKINIKARN